MAEGLQALTERERETLRLLVGGHDIKSIAGRMDLSVHTVNERLREARRKLGVSSSRQAARLLADAEHGPQFSADMQTGVAASASAAGRSVPPAQGRGRSLAWLGGGVLIMSSIVAAVVLVSMLQAGADPARPAPASAAAPTPSPAALNAARQWAGLLDGKRWDQSWTEAGAAFRAQITPAVWSARVQQLRESFGPVSSRTFQTVEKVSVLPGAPQGEYEVIHFVTHFERKPGAIETVVMTHEPSGWKVNGYFIK